MEFSSIQTFVENYKKTRLITNKVLAVIPVDNLDWTYKDGKFTIADIIRHLAAIERFVFAELVNGNKPKYKGCKSEITVGYKTVFNFLDAMHLQSLKIFKNIKDINLSDKISLIEGSKIEIRKLLRNLIIHEVHHRGALCIYLNLLGISTPPVLGLMEEQLIQLSL